MEGAAFRLKKTLKRPFMNYFFIWRFVLANIILIIEFMRGIY